MIRKSDLADFDPKSVTSKGVRDSVWIPKVVMKPVRLMWHPIFTWN
jgi:hypothetical protein